MVFLHHLQKLSLPFLPLLLAVMTSVKWWISWELDASFFALKRTKQLFSHLVALSERFLHLFAQREKMSLAAAVRKKIMLCDAVRYARILRFRRYLARKVALEARNFRVPRLLAKQISLDVHDFIML